MAYRSRYTMSSTMGNERDNKMKGETMKKNNYVVLSEQDELKADCEALRILLSQQNARVAELLEACSEAYPEVRDAAASIEHGDPERSYRLHKLADKLAAAIAKAKP